MSGRVPLPVVDRLGQWGRASQDPASGREILAECLLCGWAHVYDRPEELFAGWGAHLGERHPRRAAQSRLWEEWVRRPARFYLLIDQEAVPFGGFFVRCPAYGKGCRYRDVKVLDFSRAQRAWRIHAYDMHPRRLYRSDGGFDA